MKTIHNIAGGRHVANKTLPTKQEDDFFIVLGNSFKLIGQSWEALLINLWTFAKIYFFPLLIFLLAFPLLLSTFIGSDVTDKDGGSIPIATIVLGIIVVIGLAILITLLAIASAITQLASVRGKKVGFKEVIEQAQSFFWRFAGLGILSVLIVIGGFILFIIPGFIALILLTFVGYVMVDKNLGVIDSLKTGMTLAKENWKLPFALFIVQTIIQIPSLIPVGGSIVSAGLGIAYFCLPAILYNRISRKIHKAKKSTV